MSKTTPARVGIIGLGIMGGTMARALLAAGHDVLGYDINTASMRALRRAGGTPMPGCAEVASGADALITSLPSAQAPFQILLSAITASGLIAFTRI